MAKFNGYDSWNAWNVSLWINNDEGLCHTVKAIASGKGSAENKAKTVLQVFAEQGITHTPDGAPYSVTTIRAAMKGM